MGIETNGGDTWQYGDEEIKEEVLDCFNEDEVDKQLSTVLMKQAESLYEKVEENYVEPEGPVEMGSPYPKGNDLNDEEVGYFRPGDRGAGRALKALAQMEITEVDIWTEAANTNRYDFTSINPESLCGVLEAVTRIESEDVNW
jgi:hypothetical protein